MDGGLERFFFFPVCHIIFTMFNFCVRITSFEEVDGLYGHVTLERIPVPPVVSGVVVTSVVLVVPVPPSVLVPVLIPPPVPVATQPLLHLHPPLRQPQTHVHPPLCKVLTHVHAPLGHRLPERRSVLPPATPLLPIHLVPLLPVLLVLLVPMLVVPEVVATTRGSPRWDEHPARHDSINWGPQPFPVSFNEVMLVVMLRH